MVEGDGGGRTENSAHFPNGVVLGDLERASEAVLTGARIPQGSPVGEGGYDDGVENATPITERDAPDRVTEDTKGENGRSRAGGKGGDVLRPGKAIIKEDAEVANGVGDRDAEFRVRRAEVEVGERGTE